MSQDRKTASTESSAPVQKQSAETEGSQQLKRSVAGRPVDVQRQMLAPDRPIQFLGEGGPSAAVQCQAVTGNTFGDWDINQTNTDGTGAGTTYASEINIDFTPKAATVDSPEIAFVQDVALLKKSGGSADERANFKNRRTDEGHTIDRVDNKKHGWYGYNNDGKPSGVVDASGAFTSGNIRPGSAPKPLTPAKLYDRPSWSMANTEWKFETYAISKSGTQANQLYGGLKWGFDVDKDCKLTSHTPTHLDKATASFNKSVKAWNDQAGGDASKRNHADQQTLGPFS